MLQIIIRQLLTAESGAAVDTIVLLLNLLENPVSESTSVLFSTSSSEFTDNMPADTILAVKHSRVHFLITLRVPAQGAR